MHRVAAKFVPRLMTSDQEAHRVQVCQDLLDHAKNDKELSSKIITGDESWVYGYDVETKVQSSQWTSKTSPRPKKARQVPGMSKTMGNYSYRIVLFVNLRNISKQMCFQRIVPVGCG